MSVADTGSTDDRVARSIAVSKRHAAESAARMAARVAELRAERPDPISFPKPGRFGARSIGDLAVVGVGDQVWARTEGADMRVTADGTPKGGIVLEVLDDVTVDDDGEIVRRRAFRVYDWDQPLHKAFRVITEAQVDPDGCETSTPAQLVTAIRRFCREVADTRSFVFTGRDAQLVHDAGRLKNVVMGESHRGVA